MIMKKIFFLLSGVLAIAIGCSKSKTETVAPVASKDSSIVISGYVPSYRISTLDTSNYNCVNRVNYFSLIPDATGAFQLLSADSSNLVTLQSHIKTGQQLFVTLGGASAGGNLTTMAKDTAKRSAYVNAVVAFCQKWNVKGVDMDWEIYNGVQPDSALFGQLHRQMYAALHPLGYLLTTAIGVAPTSGATSKYLLAKNVYASVDAINVMAYGPNAMDTYGNQATMLQAQNYLSMFVANGVPAAKLLLGVPFYLNSKTATPTAQLYSWLLTQVPNLDSAANTYQTYGYNGIKLMQDKVKFLRHNGYAGIVAWEMGQDVIATSPYSLIRTINAANQ
jgi:GH18 family chitinase